MSNKSPFTLKKYIGTTVPTKEKKRWVLGHEQEGLRLESSCCAIHYKQPAAQMAESPEHHACQWHTKAKAPRQGMLITVQSMASGGGPGVSVLTAHLMNSPKEVPQLHPWVMLALPRL